MSFDTIKQNKLRQDLTDYAEIWVFGYGSLIYKVDFPILQKAPASIKGWQRRFWQGSHDHRGTPEAPGRVLTLIAEAHAECAGMAYRVDHAVFEHLDHREKNGYLRYEVDLHFHQTEAELVKGNQVEENQAVAAKSKGTQIVKKGLVYIAPTDNAAYLGPATEKAIAQHIFESEGPSGKNKDYVFALAEGLRELNEVDEHVFAIDGYLRELEKG